MKKYLALDLETGGLGSDTSLLSACFFVVSINKDLELFIHDDLELFLRPNNGTYVVEAGGLECNGINLVEHNKTAIPYSIGGGKLREFLIKHSKEDRLIPLGHGINGDLDTIDNQLLGRKTTDQYLAAVPIDTCIMAKIMQDLDIYPEDRAINLEALVNYYNISSSGDKAFHTARFDAYMTAIVYSKMLADIKSQYE